MSSVLNPSLPTSLCLWLISPPDIYFTNLWTVVRNDLRGQSSYHFPPARHSPAEPPPRSVWKWWNERKIGKQQRLENTSHIVRWSIQAGGGERRRLDLSRFWRHRVIDSMWSELWMFYLDLYLFLIIIVERGTRLVFVLFGAWCIL